MNNLDKIQNLTPEQLEKLGRLIDKFDRQNTEEDIPKQSKGRKSPKKKIILPTDEEYTEKIPQNKKQGRKSPRNQVEQKIPKRQRGNQPTRGRGDKQARTEAVSLSNENKFERMSERLKYKKDTKIDRLLWGKNKPEDRPDEYHPVEVQCEVCELWFDVSPKFLIRDADTKELKYTCNDCSAAKGK